MLKTGVYLLRLGAFFLFANLVVLVASLRQHSVTKETGENSARL